MIQQFHIGKPITVRWIFRQPNGDIYSLVGFQYKVSCRNSRGMFSIKSTVDDLQNGMISFVLPAEMQTCPGVYSLTLDFYQAGRKFNTVQYSDAFLLDRYSEDECSGQHGVAGENSIDIYSVGEYGLFKPVNCIAGTDGYWYLDGQPVVGPDGEKIPAYFRLKVISEGDDKGRFILYTGIEGTADYRVVWTYDALKDIESEFERYKEAEKEREKAELERRRQEIIRDSQEQQRQADEILRRKGEQNRQAQFESGEAERQQQFESGEEARQEATEAIRTEHEHLLAVEAKFGDLKAVQILTQQQYDDLVAKRQVDPDTLYFVE